MIASLVATAMHECGALVRATTATAQFSAIATLTTCAGLFVLMRRLSTRWREASS
ncbi:MAG: hypothetical protein AABZ29_10325 [Gemmatimonadota bacterium]